MNRATGLARYPERGLRWLLRPSSIALVALFGLCSASMSEPIVIAHRGASGYLPEHTLASKALAHGMGAHYIEQDVVLTRDGIPIVLHDIHLESTTDVEQRFPDRAREDGRYYAIDFDIAEIRELRLHERSFHDDAGLEHAFFPSRFPLGRGVFQLPTLEEEIQFINGLDRSRGTKTGLYIELKSPQWHRSEGYDIATAVLKTLAETGYADREDQVFLQCFDSATLIQLNNETSLPLIQLIGENAWGEDGAVDYNAMREADGLKQVARYARGIGPRIEHVINDQLKPTPLVATAKQHGLLVHPYTLRADQLSAGAQSLDALHKALFIDARVDGVFTDFPDLTVEYLKRARP